MLLLAGEYDVVPRQHSGRPRVSLRATPQQALRIKEQVSDLESKLEDVDFKVEELEELDSKLEEVSEKVEDLEGQLADAEFRIDDLESEDPGSSNHRRTTRESRRVPRERYVDRGLK